MFGLGNRTRGSVRPTAVRSVGMTADEPCAAGPRPPDGADVLLADAALGSVPADAQPDADQAITAIYSTEYRSLVRLAAVLVGDVGIAEEVVQDSFVALYGAWSRLRDRDKALAYLRQGVINRSRSALRQGTVARERAHAKAGHHAKRRAGRNHATRALGGDVSHIRTFAEAAGGAHAPVLPGPGRTAGRFGHGYQPGCGELPYGPGQGGHAERPVDAGSERVASWAPGRGVV